MNNRQQFQRECAEEIRLIADNQEVIGLSSEWINAANRLKYPYHFEWMGTPIIQYPQDIIAMQEIIW
jgi:cephalosporin hydroxylase